MAKKKSKKRGASKSRRRRVSGVHPVMRTALEGVAGAVAGGIAATFANQAIKTSFTTAPAWVGGAVCLAAGAALPLFTKPNPIVMGAAAGLAAMGGTFMFNETLISLPGISGIPGAPMSPGTRPGFINTTVGRAPARGRVGNLSGNKSVIGAIMEN